MRRGAGAGGETRPQLELHALEAIGRYYNGRIYPGYPEPKVAEAEQALDLATILARHADERVPVILDERRSPAQHTGPTTPQRRPGRRGSRYTTAGNADDDDANPNCE